MPTQVGATDGYSDTNGDSSIRSYSSFKNDEVTVSQTPGSSRRQDTDTTATTTNHDNEPDSKLDSGTKHELAEPPPREPCFAYDPSAAAEGWHATYDILAAQDTKMLKGYQDEIDSMLIFAGLFSAVLTAFVVESYHNLQEDYTRTTHEILLQISSQMANSSIPAGSSAPFEVTSSDLRVNIFWFIGLILSLSSALFGIFFKQWMRSYMTWVDISPARTAVTVRQFRHEAILRWKLNEMVMMLPVLLQISLILFGIGLVDFCFHLNVVLGATLCAVGSICLIAVISAIIIPLFSSSSPYRAPWSALLAKWRLRITRWTLRLKARQRIMSDEDRKLWNTFMVYPYGSLTWDTWSRLPSWDQLDQASMKISTMLESTALQPSWEARGVSCLPLSVHSEEHVHQIMQCLFDRTSSIQRDNTWSLHILDCWQIAGCLFGKNAASAMKLLDETKFHGYASAMSPTMRQKLLCFLMQGLHDWIPSSESANPLLIDFTRQVVVMMRCIWYMCINKKEDARIFGYLSLLLRIREKSQPSNTLEGWLDEEYIIDYTTCLSLDYLRPMVLLREWSSYDIVLHTTALIQALVQHRLVLGEWIGLNIGTTAVLLAAQLPELTSTSHPVIQDFLLALEQLGQPGVKQKRVQERLDPGPLFWQAIHVLGSNHPTFFSEQLLHYLLSLAMPEQDRLTARELSLDVKWGLLLAQSRRLGTSARADEWICPGFDPV